MRQHKKRNYRVKKTSLADENIDRQIQAIHFAIAKKLLAHPKWVEFARDNIERKQKLGQLTYGAYLHWISTLDNIANEKLFVLGLTEYSAKLRKWRRQTPFTGILTEDERVKALEANSLGALDSIVLNF
ncbi:hypothetical protein [Catenovulum sediminis]|uniref:Uncharacterized protein n=1 Tax=Catenovulum sediminis TaxID=1740262 RepID=A0ABV1RJ28_9ALTE|nr:hypothetical protein [Catenovulum sediminis]